MNSVQRLMTITRERMILLAIQASHVTIANGVALVVCLDANFYQFMDESLTRIADQLKVKKIVLQTGPSPLAPGVH